MRRVPLVLPGTSAAVPRDGGPGTGADRGRLPVLPVQRATAGGTPGPASAPEKSAPAPGTAANSGPPTDVPAQGVPAQGAPATGVPPTGVPVTAVPTRSGAHSASAPPPSPQGSASPGAPEGSGLELDDLARRLIDPVSRLLRAELRRGRERTGRPFDGRR